MQYLIPVRKLPLLVEAHGLADGLSKAMIPGSEKASQLAASLLEAIKTLKADRVRMLEMTEELVSELRGESLLQGFELDVTARRVLGEQQNDGI